jgi:hypothetical protein
VRQPVVLVVALLVEALAAVLARVRPVALVDAHVRVQRRAEARAHVESVREQLRYALPSVEGLSACLAFMRLFVGVNYFVPAQSGRLAEAFAANFAHERPSTF